MPDVEKLLNAIDAAESNAYGSEDDSELHSVRARAIDYYLGRNIDPAPEGRSQVVDRSVFETVQWILPSLCRIFANGDNIVELVPFGPEDEEQAKQETDYLNYVVTQKNRWFNVCLSWFQDALLLPNGYCLTYMEEVLQVEKERYEGQSEEAVSLLMQEDGAEVIGFEPYPDESSPPQPVMDPMTGQPGIDPTTGQPMMQQRVLYDIEIKRTKPKKKLCFQVLPPERTKVSESTRDHTLEYCDYFEYWEFKTLSQLRAEGFDVPDDLASDEEVDTEEDDARDRYEDHFAREGENPIDPAMRRVKARMIWIRHDYDEDGISEMQRVVRVGNEILYREETSRIHVSSLASSILTHRHPGISVADMVADIQRIKTAILRGGLDNLYLANNPRTVINEQINLDDMLVSRPGGVVRSEGDLPVAQNYAVIATPNVFPQAMEGLEYMDRVREQRTGINRQFAGIDENTLEPKTATEVSQLSTMAAQRVEQIARIFASGVEYLFAVAHELILKHGHQADVVKLRGKWVTVDPSSWRTGRDMRIVVGFGAGNKDVLAARLLTILQLQKEAIAGGLPVANAQNVYEALVEITKASDFTAPQRFWTDPSTVEPPPPPPDPIQIGAQIEQDKIASGERIKGAEIDSEERLKRAELEHKERLAQFDAEVKVMLEQIKQGGSADLERLRGSIKNEPAKLETQKVVAEAQASQQQLLDGLKAELREAIESVAKSIAESMSAPREVVRGKDGRVSGVRVNGVERAVQRDGQGRVTGLQ